MFSKSCVILAKLNLLVIVCRVVLSLVRVDVCGKLMKTSVLLVFDDFMGENTTDSDGRFSLSGTLTGYGGVEPKLKVYHDCDPLVVSQSLFHQRI